MKTLRTFKDSWLFPAVMIAILVGGIVVWELSNYLGHRNNPFVVAFLCLGLVAAMASVLYEGAS